MSAVLCIFLSEERHKKALLWRQLAVEAWDGIGRRDAEKERGFGMWSECTSWNSKPFLGCLAPLTTGESGKEGRCAPSSARCRTPGLILLLSAEPWGALNPSNWRDGYGWELGAGVGGTCVTCLGNIARTYSVYSFPISDPCF